MASPSCAERRPVWSKATGSQSPTEAPEITLLGEVTVTTGHRPATRLSVARPILSWPGEDPDPGPEPLGSLHSRVVLAMLTLERHQGVSRGALADAMWPDGLPPTWNSALRTRVSRVRAYLARAFGHHDDVLVARGGSYMLLLPPDTVVDVELVAEQVVAAQKALAHGDYDEARWLATAATERLRAPFLPDHDGEWVARRRGQLAELLVTGLEVTSGAATGLADTAGALAAAREAVDRAPLRESAHRGIMAAHAAAGNRGEALRAYQRLRRRLADELGVDPDLETENAYLALLGPATTVRRPAEEAGVAAAARFDEPAPLVGRTAELATAVQAWTRAAGGASEILLVTGEAGIGKTRLAAELARTLVGDGARVLFGRCEPDGVGPYQPFVEILDALAAATPLDEQPPLSAAARSELGSVFPAFAPFREEARPLDRPLLFDAVARLVAHAAADRPVLVVVDDIQWIDSDGALLLRHVLRRLSAIRLLVVALCRDDLAPNPALMTTLRVLDHANQVCRLPLVGLGPDQCVTLARQLRPSGAVPLVGASQLETDTAGNPSLLLELLDALHDGAPVSWPQTTPPPFDRLDHLVDRRLAPLGLTARRLLDAAALAGPSFDLGAIAAVTRLDDAAAVDAIEAIQMAKLVVEVGADESSDRYRFTHDLIRRVLSVRPSRARRRHLRGPLLSPAAAAGEGEAAGLSDQAAQGGGAAPPSSS